MHLIGQILLGIIFMIIGILLLKYNYQVTNNLPISFAEEHMGSGGSYALWKILAILVIFIGLLVMFGLHDNMLNWLLSPLTNIMGQGNTDI